MSRPLHEAILEGLFQHRLLTTGQIHALYTPTTLARRTRRLVSALEGRGLVAAVPAVGGGRRKVLYLTPDGIDAVQGAPTAEPRSKLLTAEQAGGPLQRHTLAVNEVGIALVHTARVRGDEFGPLAWQHEIAHPIGAPPGRKRQEELIADALLTYQQQADDGSVQFLYRFLELDRATMPAPTLAAKLARYARMHRHMTVGGPGSTPRRFWETRYPVFPTVLLVLDGAGRERLERRRRAVLLLCAEDHDLQRTPAVEVSACLLEDLRIQGPFAAIWRTPADPDRPVDWLGETADSRSRSLA